MRLRRILTISLGMMALVALIAAGVGYFWVQRTLETPFKAYDEPETVVQVKTGSGAAQILRQLQEAGVILDHRMGRLYLEHKMGNPSLQAGEYRFTEPMTLHQALEKLIRGEVVTYGVTLIEGLTAEETAAHLMAEGFGDREVFREIMSSPELIADLDPSANNLEGYLFPDTYRFPRDTSEKVIVRTMVETFRRRWQEQVEPLRASGSNAAFTVREIVTLASIVEKEAQVDEERPVIAGVYSNRLARGIALYADPTVIFALRLQGRWNGNLRRADLQMDSPYNTYRYPGLPPGPIASSGLASLQAAADPAAVPYLYFVSRNDGTHVFAETLAEHNRNVNEWQKRYWRQRLSRQAK
ncbi:MAG: endolytic transglycosylase MltG [Deltaproteobacteria bacterium]|nr:endolytic transglycosylase MltG [Deltaproteobacteria bacterium]